MRIIGVMGSLVVMATSFRPEGPDSIPDAARDPLHAVYTLVRSVVPKVLWSVASSLPWVLLLEKFPSFSKTYQNCGSGQWMVLPSVVVRQKSDSCFCKNRPSTSGITYPLCLKPFTGLGFQVAHVNNNENHSYLLKSL